ncbi:MAG: glycerol-3-phosphate acyltransferase PlsX [Myxococcota bacterium]|jgi:glycerol-3-phosphate acyltransferase PlsX
MPTIAVDALGGLRAPDATVEAAAEISRKTTIDVVLVGDPQSIERRLSAVSYNPERLRVHPSPAHPSQSVQVAADLVVAGVADALVTAGDPPVALRACYERFERLPGVHRAPLAAVYPTAPRPGNRDPFALILDVGATLRADASDLVSWAKMGAAYARAISRVEAPTIGLLSTGRDARSGPPEVVEAHRILVADSELRFVGNIEGLDIPRGGADVIVCDGYVGQVVIGLLGGVSDALLQAARGAWSKKISWRMGLRLLEDAVVGFHETIQHEAYGGAPLLGFDKVAILALPTSEARSLSNAIKLAAKAVREDVPGVVARALAEPS